MAASNARRSDLFPGVRSCFVAIGLGALVGPALVAWLRMIPPPLLSSGRGNPYAWAGRAVVCFAIVLGVLLVVAICQALNVRRPSGVPSLLHSLAALSVRAMAFSMSAIVGLAFGMFVAGYLNSLVPL